MAAFQSFRSAFNGFNREDVVHYIEYINNKHASQVNQLNTEIQTLQSELAAARAQASASPDVSAALEAANVKIAELEEALAEANNRTASSDRDSELEAYRRAERAERAANERVSQLYCQANGVIADATAHADEAAGRIADAAAGVTEQLSRLQAAIAESKDTLAAAAAAMYALKPTDSE